MPLCVEGSLILCAGFAAGQYRQCLGSEGNRPTQVYVGAVEALRTAVDQRVLSEPQFILWDDSRLPTQRGPEVASEFAMWELNQLARRFPPRDWASLDPAQLVSGAQTAGGRIGI